MKKTPKYVVMREKKENAKRAFDTYKDVVFRDGDIPSAVVDAQAPPKRTDDHEDRPRKAKYPDYYNPAAGLGIVDIYQSESSAEDEGVNVLRVELTDGTIREFRVKNGSKGDDGCAGLGGMRGPKGPKGDPASPELIKRVVNDSVGDVCESVKTGNYGLDNTVNTKDSCSVFGNNNTVGGMGYKILKYKFKTSENLDPNVTVYNGTTTLVLGSAAGIAVGNTVSIEMNDSTQRFATVKSINGNTVVLDKAYYDEAVAVNGSGVECDISNSNFSLILPEIENSGDSKVAGCGYVLGNNNRTIADNAFAAGDGNSAEGRNSFVSGKNNVAGYAALVGGEDNNILAEHGFGVGYKNKATARYAAAIGYNNDATGPASMAIGDNTEASGVGAFAHGYATTASGSHSHAEGAATKATGVRTHSEGYGSEAAGYASHAEGHFTKAVGSYTHTEGSNTEALAPQAHAEGDHTIASGVQSHAEGLRSVASGENSHAEGADTKAEKAQSHAEGLSTTASGYDSHSEGNATIASGDQSHAEGLGTLAEGVRSHAEGEYSRATGSRSHAEGNGTLASAWNAHAEGDSTEATGSHSHAEGFHSLAQGGGSHAEGEYTQATGSNAHAEGIQTKATGAFSHAENCYTEANGARSHAEGNRAKANGESSHAGGHYSQANGKYSFAHGEQVIANLQSQFVVGAYNDYHKANILFAVGNGTSDSNRVNAFEVTKDGRGHLAGKEISTKEEWIDIADITLTEEVTYVFFDKDINGNPFECKKIVAKVISPSVLTGAIWASTTEQFWLGIASGVNIVGWQEIKEIVVRYKVNKGNFVEIDYIQNTGIDNGEQYFVGEHRHENLLFKKEKYRENIKGFRFGKEYDDGGIPFPIGARIKIWGLKA